MNSVPINLFPLTFLWAQLPVGSSGFPMEVQLQPHSQGAPITRAELVSNLPSRDALEQRKLMRVGRGLSTPDVRAQPLRGPFNLHEDFLLTGSKVTRLSPPEAATEPGDSPKAPLLSEQEVEGSWQHLKCGAEWGREARDQRLQPQPPNPRQTQGLPQPQEGLLDFQGPRKYFFIKMCFY